ncbi:hypothetical protein [Chitinophaga vietnamensis]|uniref:hypothetical protein n=1 Tax=Chitinophaga vietnamensis TaxID=2593957 RepID=UPI0011782817|nr:hypothetical protein [Chitinophaga vietnamensis]
MRSVLLLLLCCYAIFTQAQSRVKDELYDTANICRTRIDDGWFTAKTISFCAYTTSSRKNGINEEMNVGFAATPSKPFSFHLSGKGEKLLVQTMNTNRISFSNRDLPAYLDRLQGNAVLFYALFNGVKNEPLNRWEMILKTSSYLELNDNKPAGLLRSGDQEYRITAHNYFGVVNSYENVCYEFHYRKQTIAAVIPGKTPRIWFSKDIEEPVQTVIAAAIAALLLR